MTGPSFAGEAVALRVLGAAGASGGPSGTGLLAGVEPGELRGALEDALAGPCAEMGRLLGADVVSVYVREVEGEGEALVIRGNVGLAREVVGNLRLRVGDGIVGWVAECLRPIAVGEAEADPHFKRVRGIGEELFPVLLAVPLVRGGRSLGVLVFQRAERRPFVEAEIVLASVMADSVAFIVAAGGRRAVAGADGDGGAGVCLLGRGLAGGIGIGRAEVMPTLEALSQAGGPAAGREQLAEAFGRIERDLGRLRTGLPSSRGAGVDAAMERMGLLLSDTRFRDRALSGGGLPALAREYARAPFRLSALARPPDRVLVERAEDVAELCALLEVIASGGRLLQAGRVWVGRRIGGFFALAAARGASAVVLDGEGEATEEAAAILAAAGVPLLVDVRGLFSWTAPGDLLVVDADRAVVRVNPSYGGVAAARARLSAAKR